MKRKMVFSKSVGIILFVAVLSPVLILCQTSGNWSPVRSWTTLYDSLGYIEEKVERDHSEALEGVEDRRHLYQIETTGKITSELDQYWHGSQWNDLHLINYSYNIESLVDTTRYGYWSAIDLDWRIWSRSITSYNERGDLNLKVWENWVQEDSTWVTVVRNTYSYDDSLLTLELNEINTNGEWIGDDQWTYSYDSQGRLTQKLWQEYEYNTWLTKQRILYSFSDENQLSVQLVQDWAAGGWVDRSRTTFEYEDSNLIESRLQVSDNEVWRNTSRWSHIYNSNDDETHFLYERWVAAPTSISSDENSSRIASIKAPYPNPFNPTTTIDYEVFEKARVRLTIYNISGKPIATLIDLVQYPGQYKRNWTGIDDQGHKVVAGIYLASIEIGNFSQVVSMVFLP